MTDVYIAFFYTETAHTLHQFPDERLFGHFMTTLNDAFMQKFAQEDDSYESDSEDFNIPPPLCRTIRIHYVSSTENACIIQPNPSTAKLLQRSQMQVSTQKIVIYRFL